MAVLLENDGIGAQAEVFVVSQVLQVGGWHSITQAGIVACPGFLLGLLAEMQNA
ncbi:MAG: hypothetical protein M5R42_14455 [Rhodocyclaceae bacterium]|nr:hypothetical protein [Rhodocyclaceae bacterium]